MKWVIREGSKNRMDSVEDNDDVKCCHNAVPEPAD